MWVTFLPDPVGSLPRGCSTEPQGHLSSPLPLDRATEEWRQALTYPSPQLTQSLFLCLYTRHQTIGKPTC